MSENNYRGDNARRPFFKRKKTCPFSGENAPLIDYKDTKLLSRYVTERGKIVPSRISSISTDFGGKCDFGREICKIHEKGRF